MKSKTKGKVGWQNWENIQKNKKKEEKDKGFENVREKIKLIRR